MKKQLVSDIPEKEISDLKNKLSTYSAFINRKTETNVISLEAPKHKERIYKERTMEAIRVHVPDELKPIYKDFVAAILKVGRITKKNNTFDEKGKLPDKFSPSLLLTTKDLIIVEIYYSMKKLTFMKIETDGIDEPVQSVFNPTIETGMIDFLERFDVDVLKRSVEYFNHRNV